MDSSLAEVTLGIDIGGTDVKIGMVDRQGNLLDFFSCPTVRDGHMVVSIDCFTGAVMEMIEKHRTSYKVAGIGLSTPGILNVDKGIVHYAINLGWVEFPLANLLAEKVNLPVWIISDVSAGTLGEYHFGSARNHKGLLYISIGTGISASYLSDGTFFPTSNGTFLNIGHASIDYNGVPCNCGNKGCLENYVSSSAIVSRVIREKEHFIPEMSHLFDELDRFGVSEIYEYANKGHQYSQKVLKEAGELLGVAIANLINIFGPALIVIGGGLSLAENYFIDSARNVAMSRLPETYSKKLVIVSATHPKHAGILGAAVHAFQKSNL